jgi:ribosomal protein L24E
MGFIYRTAVSITRKPPYVDWANGSDDDGPELTLDLARRRDTVYLVGSSQLEQTLEEVLTEWWQDIFEEELACWMDDEANWPAARTREMFDAWFDAEISPTVIDLAPDEPLTEEDVEFEDLAVAYHTCAWCERELEKGEGRFSGFTLADRERLAHREGRVLAMVVGKGRVVTGIVTPAGSEEAGVGDDLVFRVCSTRCEKPLKKLVPRALRDSKWLDAGT